jgi:predicted TIM-barrel fold metal-dependent hydrolase
VPKAKFPVVDIHGHAPQGALSSPENLANHVKALDSLNVRVFVAADNMSGANLTRAMGVVNASPFKDRIRIFTGVQVNNFGPGSAEKLVAQLEADVKAGAVGIGEISKGFGLTARKVDGSRLAVDEPGLDPVWQAAARLNIPVFIHTAEPQEFFSPLDMKNERWLELALFRDRRNYEPEQVKFEQLMTERDNLFRRNPKTRFIAAHFGWHANDLGRLAKLLDTFPNVDVEAGAILYDLGRQPRAAREFFIKYQDRVMFGKDSFQPEEYPYYWRVFETNDEYFDYYRDYHAFWKLYGIGLPGVVLKKHSARRQVCRRPAGRDSPTTRRGARFGKISRDRRSWVHRLPHGGRTPAARTSGSGRGQLLDRVARQYSVARGRRCRRRRRRG